MPERRKKIWILLCGIFISTATQLCHAQDPGTSSEVKKPPAEAKPARKTSETSWYWRLLEGLAIGTERYNTEKQSDGRHPPLGNAR